MKKIITIVWFLLPGMISLFAQNGAAKTNAIYEAYIRKYAPIAVKHMQEYGIPASITLAQGLLESGAGTSDLARNANNHFGIKCHKDWSGDTFFKDDDAANECFRKYTDAGESFKDHALFLTTRSRYSALFQLKITDYKGWAFGLKEAGYATNPVYAERLIEIIERYELYRYDEGKTRWWHNLFRKRVRSKVLASPHLPASLTGHRIFKVNRVECTVLNEGESLQSFADSMDIRPWMLRKYNDLQKEDTLKPGDKIFLQSKKRKGSQDYHILKSGETLFSVSQEYGIRLNSLLKINQLTPGATPVPGSKILLR